MNGLLDSQEDDLSPPQSFYGKYRATVLNNVDPMFQGRIQVLVPDVSDFLPTTWAMPCVPIGWKQMGFLSVPPITSEVWIEFEQGNPDKPIWTGCFWGNPVDVPKMALMTPPPAPGMFLQLLNNSIVINNAGIFLQCSPVLGTPGISITPAGIILQDGAGGMITIAAGTVTINRGNLVVLP
jgi:hypothetical protein